MNDFYLIILDDGIVEGWGPFFLLVCGGWQRINESRACVDKGYIKKEKGGELFFSQHAALCFFSLKGGVYGLSFVFLFLSFSTSSSSPFLPYPSLLFSFFPSVFIPSNLLISLHQILCFRVRFLSSLLLSFLSLVYFSSLGVLSSSLARYARSFASSPL